MHPHEILNELRRVTLLLELAHQHALLLTPLFEEADDDFILELTDLLAHVRGLRQDHELGSDDELQDDELDEA